MVVIAAVCGVGALPGGVVLPQTSGDWVAMVHIALVAGALSLVAQAWAQAHLTATRAAVVMTMEPVFAASFAVLPGGEVLTPKPVSTRPWSISSTAPSGLPHSWTASVGPPGRATDCVIG